MNKKAFILWDRKDGPRPPLGEDGEFISSGVLGVISEDNVLYLNTYGKYPGDARPGDLAVGECIVGVRYSLCGTSGWYDIYRVR